MINAAYDVWVWVATGLFLALMGARAWAVETGQVRLGRTSTRVKVLTGATGVVLVGLVGLLAVQGGVLLVTSIVTRTDPSVAYYSTQNQPAAPAPAAPAPAAPGG